MTSETHDESVSPMEEHPPLPGKEVTITHDEALKPAKLRSRRYLKLHTAWNWLSTDSWTLEYASLALAIGSLASVAGVLGYYKERATVDGPRLLNLNTVISFLGTIMKGAMMLAIGSCLGQLKWVMYSREKGSLRVLEVVDDASRGPLGAAHLLLLRYKHVVSLGCVVTLMALASDAFIQQSVTYPYRTVDSLQAASLPWVRDYWFTVAYFSYDPADDEIDPTLEAAIYDGALASDLTHTSSSIVPVCATGNCTFPKFASLAFCSQCVDASQLVKQGPMEYILPNGLSIPNTSYSTIPATPYFNASSTLPSLNLVQATNSTFADASFLYSWLLPPQDSDVEIVAYQCTLVLCLEVYQAEVRQGVLSETTEAQFTPLWQEDVSYLVGSIPPTANMPEFGNFSMNWDNFNSISAFWQNSLRCLNDSTVRTLADMIAQNEQGSPSRQSLPEKMSRIAASMTNNIRQSTNNVDPATAFNIPGARVGGPQTINGTAHTFETYIYPRWLWLTYPLVMVLLASFFCGLTIWQSTKQGLPNWKSSALAVMLHGLQEGEEDIMEGTRAGGRAGKEPISMLEEWADDIDVRLRRRGNTGVGYGLVRAERVFGH